MERPYAKIDRIEAQLSQINENIRETIGDVTRYNDTENLKNEILTVYCREMKGEIPEDMLKQFLDNLFENLKVKIRSHPKIRPELDSIKTDEILQLARNISELTKQLSQCRTTGQIQTPEGWCKSDFLTEGFVGKVKLILGTHVNVLEEVNYSKIVKLVEKMERDPEYIFHNL